MLLRLMASVLLLVTAHNLGATEPVSIKEPLRPFAAGDLTHFESWLKGSGREDPAQVFALKDGVLRISGDDRGYLATKEAYRDYHLTVEYKWGEHRSDKSKYVRNSGVLLHGTGAHGSAGAWMTSIEVQLAQGCEGDLIVIGGKDAEGKAYPATITSDTRVESDKRTRWDPQGKKTVSSGKQFWWSKHDPAFEELLDMRGRWDVASKFGEWTKVECLCRGDRITIKINDQTVNEAYDVKPAAGRILLQNEGYEVFFRRLVIAPLVSREAAKAP